MRGGDIASVFASAMSLTEARDVRKLKDSRLAIRLGVALLIGGRSTAFKGSKPAVSK
jgi:hypothetical protein